MRDTRPVTHQFGVTEDPSARDYIAHASAKRINTEAYILNSLRTQYPDRYIVATAEINCPLLEYAQAKNARATILDGEDKQSILPMKRREYHAPRTHLDGEAGTLKDVVFFAKYDYTWKENSFIIYLSEGRDGASSYPKERIYYIIGDRSAADELMIAAGRYGEDLHEELWVYNDSQWNRDHALWESVQKASWDNVILDADMKEALISDVESFYASRNTYIEFGIPWKRGVIYYGPPGNGKTISLKAMVHSLESQKPSIPSLYVRSLVNFMGPERALGEIFAKARQTAPCLLIFEDLDSLITPQVRSYFLNEIDGLTSNQGIFVIGSTNHIEWLDPGISKRPSRFDRKYLFPDPNLEQRVQYCEFWQKKLKKNKAIEFPNELCKAIAEITKEFSFAYIQEAFLAALLKIASQSITSSLPGKAATSRDKDELDQYVLWREIKKQVKILREDLERSLSPRATASNSNSVPVES
jgi:transitional endoplasmic reticulum ATPase